MSDAKPTSGRKCPECEGAMHEIYIVDRSHAADGKLTYAAAETSRDFFFGRIQAKGTVEAFACAECGRILLYTNKGGKP